MTQALIRSETERQFYLGMAGIRMWYAREPLPGAAPSPDYDFGAASTEAPEPPVPVAPRVRPATPSSSVVEADKKDQLARLKTLMDTVPGRPATAARPQVPTPAEVPVAMPPSTAAADALVAEESVPVASSVHALGQVPRLCLQSWSGSGVLLLANLSEEASLSLQETLALNIVRSLGDSGARAGAVVRWPLFNNLKVSLNSETDLAALMRDYLPGASGKAVITLGLAAESSVITGVLAEVLAKTPEVVFEHSLAALAAEPALKRQLWQLIQPLAGKA